MKKIRGIGYTMLGVALLLSAAMPIAFKLGSNINPLKLMFFASMIGTVTSFLIMIAKHTAGNSVKYFTKRKPFLVMAAFGVLDYTILTLILAYATHFVSAALTAVVYRSWALMLVLLAPLIIRERITKYDIAAVLIGFTSFAIVMLQGTPLSMPLYVLPFVGLILLGAFFDAFANAVTKRYNYEITSSIFAYNLMAFAIFLPLALFYGQASIMGITASDLLAMLFIGIVVDVALTFTFVGSIRMLDVTIVGNANMLVPFITMLLSFLLLNERIYWYYFAIAIGVTLGIIVQRLAPKGSNYITRSEKTPRTTIFDVSGAFVNTHSPKIYGMLEGNGRVLAMLADNDFIENGAFGERCIIFTDKKPIEGVSADELDFVKEIVAPAEGQSVIIGVGEPDQVELSFKKILLAQQYDNTKEGQGSSL
ncbi:MAG: EamA family transporter [Candidatus Micrarchaeaceae archaeon]